MQKSLILNYTRSKSNLRPGNIDDQEKQLIYINIYIYRERDACVCVCVFLPEYTPFTRRKNNTRDIVQDQKPVFHGTLRQNT